jgi:glycosyltransferase involved in cell wall biosynthesis
VKATVLLVTYNHAPYIVQALDSVLAQVTDFPWEIIISEDCSTDGTRTIVERYAEGHPDRIRLLLSERNRNDNEVIARGLRAAVGEFIAYLDGDDWWTVPHKLATQVRFLEQNPGCVMCYHSVLRIHEDGSRPPHPSLPPGPRPPMTLEDVLARYYINSCSVAFRRAAVPELPAWYYSADLADWALAVLLSTRGTVGYVDEVMAAYRIHVRGVWSGLTPRQRIEARLAFFDRLGGDFERRHGTAVRGGRAQAHLDLAHAWEAEGKPIPAASHALQSLWQRPGGRFLSPAARLRVVARVFLPWLRRSKRTQREPRT